MSPAYETIFGRPVDEIYQQPRSWLEAIHPDDRPRVSEAAHRQADGHYDVEYRVVRPDRSIRWVHDRGFPVRDPSGRIVRIAGVAEDVSDRRVLEQQLRQTQKLESVGRLAGGVAHDFNNLLTVIVSSGEMLRNEALPPDALEMIEDVLDAGRRGAALTRQLLAFSRQEVVEPRVVALDTVVADAEKLLRRLIGEDVVLTTRLGSASTPVCIDRDQWTQVLFNLAVNARDAMPRGGRLAIETDTVDADDHHPRLARGRWARLRITDSGTGMTAEVRSRIFEPFFTTKPHGKGTGLGLAVVYGVVQQAGGHVDVESEVGAGTAFTIHLPSSAATPPQAQEAPATLGGGVETILVVEDEESVRRVVVRILTSAGYRVLAAADAVEARRLLADEAPPHVLVTDVIMPGDDGPTLAAEVRARFPSVKVLFTSGYLGDSTAARGVSAESLLQKPYTPAVLRDRIRRLLDER